MCFVNRSWQMIWSDEWLSWKIILQCKWTAWSDLISLLLSCPPYDSCFSVGHAVMKRVLPLICRFNRRSFGLTKFFSKFFNRCFSNWSKVNGNTRAIISLASFFFFFAVSVTQQECKESHKILYWIHWVQYIISKNVQTPRNQVVLFSHSVKHVLSPKKHWDRPHLQ